MRRGVGWCCVRRRQGIYSQDFVVVCKTFFFSLSFLPTLPFSLSQSFSSLTPSFVYYAAVAMSPSVFKLASKSRLFFLLLGKKRVCGSLGASAPATYIHLYLSISNHQWRRARLWIAQCCFYWAVRVGYFLSHA